jgi:predicted Fe-S protein YdhL (DUF1289 family)
MQYLKHQYVRSQKLLKLVAGLACQNCGIDNGVQAAHTNWGGGKGRGIKADDNLVAALCLKCHYEIDQGAHLSKDERQELWQKAHQRTVDELVNNNQWPKDVPIPIY